MSIIKQGNELRALGFGLHASFIIKLEDQSELNVAKILRILPGRRIVAAGIWQKKKVVAKFFLDKHHANRHIKDEMIGNKLLIERNVPTPKLHAEMKTEDKEIPLLIFNELTAEVDLTAMWQQRNRRDQLMVWLKMLMVEIATQHVFGLIQHDMHINNFIFAKNTIYTLDGAQLDIFPYILPKKQSMGNLALLLSQLGAGAKHYQADLYRYYSKARGWVWKEKDLKDLFEMIDGWNKERWDKFEKKIFRNSTHFCRNNTWRTECVYDRQYAKPEFLQMLQHPESAFTRSDKIMLKNGRSATVIRLSLDGREYVIKRYNMKHIGHWLRRCLRITRAKRCWRLAQKLQLSYIKTAKPVAYIETKFLGLRNKSYFITEYVAGHDIKHYLQHQIAENANCAAIVAQAIEVIDSLHSINMTHGDLKATNLLVDEECNLVLIDLDGTREYKSVIKAKRAARKEWQRFLKNFDQMPLIKDIFVKHQNT